jgi:hypothetical protein
MIPFVFAAASSIRFRQFPIAVLFSELIVLRRSCAKAHTPGRGDDHLHYTSEDEYILSLGRKAFIPKKKESINLLGAHSSLEEPGVSL